MNQFTLSLKGKLLLLIVFLVLLVSALIITVNISLTHKSRKMINKGISEKITNLQDLSKNEFNTFKGTVNYGIREASGITAIENITVIVLNHQKEFNKVVQEEIEKMGKKVEITLDVQHRTVHGGLKRLFDDATQLMYKIIEFDDRSLAILSNIAVFNVDSLKEASNESLEIFSKNIDLTDELLNRMQEKNKEDMDTALAEIINKSDSLKGKELMDYLVSRFEILKNSSDKRVSDIREGLRRNFDKQSKVMSEEVNIVADKVNLAITNERKNSKIVRKRKMESVISKLMKDEIEIQKDIKRSIRQVNEIVELLKIKLPDQLKKRGELSNKAIEKHILDRKMATNQAESKISKMVDRSNKNALQRVNNAIAESNKVIEKTFNDESRKTLLFSFLIAVISSLFAIALGALLIRGITTPISKVMQFADRVSHGKRMEKLPEGHDEIGRMGAALNTMVDKLLKLEEANRNSFNQTLDQVFDCVFMFDPENLVYSFANKGAVDQTGYSREELLCLSPIDIKPDFEKEQYLELLGSIKRGEREALFLTTVHRKKNGELIPVEILTKYVIPTTGKGRYVEIVKDISEIKKAEKEKEQLQSQLLHAQKLESVGLLAAGIAHEINTPMQFIGTNMEFLEEASDSITSLTKSLQKMMEKAPPDIADQLRNIFEEADLEFMMEEVPDAIQQSKNGIAHVSSIVKAMKEFSHPASHEKTEVVVNSIIETTILISRNEWKYISDVKTDLAVDLPAVPCLIDEFGQVILNLIVNATQAIEEKLGENIEGKKGEIYISTRRYDSGVEVKIRDTGNGIPADIQERIFDPFFTTKVVGKGTGQGLAISHDVICQKLGGTLTFETEKGKGTTFIIRLPVNV